MALAYFYISATDSYSVVNNSCTAGAVVIPSTHDDGSNGSKAVTSIGVSAFQSCTSLTSVTIPNSVTSIGVSAFRFCSSLASVTLPTNINFTSIPNTAFQSCTSLTSIIIPNSVTIIGSQAFSGCTSLTSIIIPNIVTSIGLSAFQSCTSLTSVTIPNSVTSIGVSAFRDCLSLTSVTIPNSVTSIGVSAFRDCLSLTTAIIGNNVDKISSFMFAGSGITNIVIGSSIFSIDNNAFQDCYSLTNINLPEGINTIGANAFNFSGLTSITIPNSVTIISDSAFSNCISLVNVVMGYGLLTIGNNMFFNCTNLANVSIGINVQSIGNSVFFQCTSLTSINIPSSVTGIGSSAFRGCTNLTEVIMSPNVTVLNSEIFRGCSKLSSFIMSDNITIIGNSAFFNCTGLKNVIISNIVEYIGAGAFSACSALTNITIPRTIIYMQEGVFYNCVNLIRVNFLGNPPLYLGTNIFLNTNANLKIYRKKNFVTGWTSTFGGKPVVLISDNVIKSGGTGKLITSIYNSDALKYIQLIESLTSPQNPITQDSKNKINSFIKQIKQIVPWNNFTAWTFIRGQNAFPFLNSTNNKYNGIVKTFGGLGGGEVISANSSTSSDNEGLSFSSPGGVLGISPSSFFTSVKSIFGVFKPTDNFYFTSLINQSIFNVYGGSGPISYTYSNLYYRSNAVYSKITRNSIDNIQTNNIGVFNLNFYKSLGTIFDANSTSNYSNGIKQFTASPLSVPNASLFNGVSIGGGIVNSGTISFVFVSDLVLTDAQMLAIHNIYKSTLGASLTNSQL